MPVHVPSNCPLPWVPPGDTAYSHVNPSKSSQPVFACHNGPTREVRSSHGPNEDTEPQSSLTSCPEITNPLSKVKGWETLGKEMAGEGEGNDPPRITQTPAWRPLCPRHHTHPPRSLPQPPSEVKQSCCCKNPGLTLGPRCLQINPPSAVPLSSTDCPNSIHPPSPLPPGSYPSILLGPPIFPHLSTSALAHQVFSW